MKQERGGARRWIAPAMLAVLTLFVFFQLQNLGPESAVRRFHEAVLTRNAERLQSVSTAQVGRRGSRWILDPGTRGLTTFLQSVLAPGPAVSFQDVRRKPGVVHVLVTYHFQPDARFRRGRKINMLWVTTKRGGDSWRVDVEGTVRLLKPFG